MSDVSQGPGWWQASDGRWYPPTAQPGTTPPAAGPPSPYRPGPSPYGPGPTPYGPPPMGYGYGYAPNPNGTPTGLPSVNGYATASMVLGLISIVICCWPLMFCSLVGLPLGIYALTRMNKGLADPTGKGMAIAGVTLSAISLALVLIGTVVTVAS